MNTQLQHTADIEIRVQAETLEELFKENIRVMNDILRKGWCEVKHHSDCVMTIRIKALKATDLLVDFLSDSLSLTYVQHALFCNIYFTELSENELEAQMYGCWVDGFDYEIKAVTYHEAYVKRTLENGWESHIIYDI